MFGLAELKQTKFYQEVLEEGLEQGLERGLEQGLEQGLKQGQQEERQQLLMPLLNRLFADRLPVEQAAIAPLLNLPPDRFLTVLVTLAQASTTLHPTAILAILEARFEQLPTSLRQRVMNLEAAQWLDLLQRSLTVQSVDDV